MPCRSCRRIGWRRPSHPLKSPTTLTRLALGAHTAKTTPGTPARRREVRAQPLPAALVGPLAEEVEVELPEHLVEGVRILDLHGGARARLEAQPVAGAESPSGSGASKKPCSCTRRASTARLARPRSITQSRFASGWKARTDQTWPAVASSRWGPSN